MSRSQQIALDLAQPESFDLADYVVSRSNAEAVRFVEQWTSSDFHFGALVGPAGSGKTHLLKGWANQHNALEIAPDADFSVINAGQSYIIDDADIKTDVGHFVYSDDFLFHAYNWARENRAKILVSAATPPTLWGRNLPDLMSRMGTVPVATIDEPDDDLLFALLIKLFSDRQLSVNIEVIHYLVERMPRSFSAARDIARLMDVKALAERRKITKDLARRCLAEL